LTFGASQYLSCFPPVPHQICRAIVLEQRDLDGFGEARVIEQDAEIVSRLVAIGLRFPGDAEFGSAGINAKSGAASLFLLSLATILASTLTVRVRIEPLRVYRRLQ